MSKSKYKIINNVCIDYSGFIATLEYEFQDGVVDITDDGIFIRPFKDNEIWLEYRPNVDYQESICVAATIVLKNPNEIESRLVCCKRSYMKWYKLKSLRKILFNF